jgi:hypothetical protein
MMSGASSLFRLGNGELGSSGGLVDLGYSAKARSYDELINFLLWKQYEMGRAPFCWVRTGARRPSVGHVTKKRRQQRETPSNCPPTNPGSLVHFSFICPVRRVSRGRLAAKPPLYSRTRANSPVVLAK